MRAPVDWTQEIRFSIVMYGGVSLAIYINGVAQELLRLVRATAKGAEGAGREPEGSEKVYRKLGQLLAHGAPVGTEQPDPDDPIRTRFVVDVVSGTSAGGINGVFLAKALVGDRSMEALQRLWVTEGDLARLLNDDPSIRDVAPLPLSDPPRSLLNSRRMYLKLLHALQAVDASGPGAGVGEPLVDELDLFVTATDIRGTPIPLQLSDRLVHERRHRNVFRFRRGGDGGDGGDAFGAAGNPALAFAARSTSAFPFAFEPMTLEQANEVLALFPDQGAPLTAAALREHLEDEPEGSAIEDRAFGDGGYLDNKPFSYAVDASVERAAARPVQRKLMYVEPAPKEPGPTASEPPNAFENVQAAVLELPRYETIREDLQRVLAHNRLVQRVQRILLGLQADFRRGRGVPTEEPSPEWADQDLSPMLDRYGVGYGPYHRLKVAAVTDRLAELVAAAGDLRGRSDALQAARHLVRAWRDVRYDHYLDEATNGRRSFNAFLLHYDLDYRIRRVRFLLRELDALAARDGTANARLRPGLEAVDARLRAARARLRGGPDRLRWPSPPPEPLWPFLAATLMAEADEGTRSQLARDLLVRPLDGITPARHRAMAEWLRHALDHTTGAAAARIREATEEAAREVRRLLAPADGVAGRLWGEYQRFEEYDLVAYPVLHTAALHEEAAPFDVFRVSPADATRLSDNADRLAGTALGNFGAFLDARWRRNDLRWGRLDGAERIITALLPEPEHETLRNDLIAEAHREILAEDVVRHGRDELVRVVASAVGEASSDDVLGRTREELQTAAEAVLPGTADVDEIYRAYGDPDFDINGSLDRAATTRLASRASRVIGDMLDGMAAPGTAGRRTVGWVARASRAAWTVVETAIPDSPARKLARHLATVFALFSALLAAVGALAGSPPMLRLGGIWLAASLLFLALRALLENAIRGGRALYRVLRLTALALATGVALLALVGARSLLDARWVVFGMSVEEAAAWAAAVLLLAAGLREAGALRRAAARRARRSGARLQALSGRPDPDPHRARPRAGA